jgi:Matrixin
MSVMLIQLVHLTMVKSPALGMILLRNILVLFVVILSSAIILLTNSDYNNILQVEGKKTKPITSYGHDSQQALDQQPSIQICCGWSFNKLSNEGLTYRIIGGSSSAQRAVHTAVDDWTSSFKGLKFTELQSSDNSAADITIKFNSKSSQAKTPEELKSPDNGIILRAIAPGASKIKYNQNGLITDVIITISKSAFGDKLSSDMTTQIAKHELGHALGLGHANFNGDLMSPTLNNELDFISKCDVNAVLGANHMLTDNNDNNQGKNILHNSFSCS